MVDGGVGGRSSRGGFHIGRHSGRGAVVAVVVVVTVVVVRSSQWSWCGRRGGRGGRTGHGGHGIGSLSSDVFKRRTSTGSEPFSLLVSLYATVFVLPSVLILKETICPKICSKSRLKCAKSPFPVDVRRSKTSLLKLRDRGYFYCA